MRMVMEDAGEVKLRGNFPPSSTRKDLWRQPEVFSLIGYWQQRFTEFRSGRFSALRGVYAGRLSAAPCFATSRRMWETGFHILSFGVGTRFLLQTRRQKLPGSAVFPGKLKHPRLSEKSITRGCVGLMIVLWVLCGGNVAFLWSYWPSWISS